MYISFLLELVWITVANFRRGATVILLFQFHVNLINSQSNNISFRKSCFFATCFQLRKFFIGHSDSIIIRFGAFCRSTHFLFFYGASPLDFAVFPCYSINVRRWQVPPNLLFHCLAYLLSRAFTFSFASSRSLQSLRISRIFLVWFSSTTSFNNSLMFISSSICFSFLALAA